MEHYFTRLEEAMRKNWDRPALCNYHGEVFTFGELAARIERFHIVFETIGLEKGDKVAICARNSARWAVSFLAITTYGAVVVPVLADFHPDSVNSLVDHSGSRILFTDPDLWSRLDIAKMPGVSTVVSVQDFSILYTSDSHHAEALENLQEQFDARFPEGVRPEDIHYPVDNAEDLAIINYTSGTTSAPKGVMLRYECLSSNVQFGQDRIPSSNADAIVSMLPLAHMYGMMYEFLYPLCGGTAIYFLGKTPTPAMLLGAMKEIRPYLVVTVPLVMEKIFKSAVLPSLRKPAMRILTAIPGVNTFIFRAIRKKLLAAFGGNVRMIIMGGAALNPDVEKWFKRFGLPFTVGYGMTEAAPLLAYEEWRKFVPRSCGKAVDRVEVRIDSEDPRNIVGEIQARGVNVMSGYYRNEEATKAAFTSDGWMNTGDLGVIDADGNIFIRGRSKNMILSSNGQNIYPEEIEAVVNSFPYVQETVVVDRNARLVVLVYLDAEKLRADGISEDMIPARMDEMMAEVNRSLPSYSKIAKVETRTEPFEKTPKMSIKRFLYS